ncbi:E3 ubiquitin-protein ligase SSM4 CYBJADRAFT_183891 [Cyberlindnera jadinii NRRL Y-1542]|uniref:RING-type E3 ubiquitin transferase n=1 Tax=Cyberlindnera jadinii (strain ATCC 18201 / CBS 1600 / BCRC 20928 / JCM 3617 / NBRC 0987 / NRRL Y-1542) TaxID=983966 RepID=A0A1E4S407_CYBJN|nr:hypothetical protein CYBJADRAFT_183891 [Cyberlindnera jadinii NRRL Y-1542]ODV74231.1 hypothetical protein CYBJADRAFT_183891 [Cyberlindnera jadinii NRRL Y-1542]
MESVAVTEVYFNALIYWGIGTTYMCLFALFIGMVRQYILRPGVLFFIRSPDDPNTRLLHEALVRPFRFQISRIALSILVYMLFILIGVGALTRGLGLLNVKVLPVDVTVLSSFLTPLEIFIISKDDAVIKKYVRQYWFRAFGAASAQMRLSSFILGKADPKERGHIRYRNLISWFINAPADYTSPKTDSEATEAFRTTPVQAVFVPDGYFVRAPRHDTVSRKYVRQLFVPVTKDDVPLKRNVPKEEPKFDDFDESEDEVTTTNQYTVVYRPPMFGVRVIVFILMLWVFSLILICGVIIAANVIGRPLFAVVSLVLGSNTTSLRDMKLDLESIGIGLVIMANLLRVYDNHIIHRYTQAEQGQVGILQLVGANRAVLWSNLKNIVSIVMVFFLWTGYFTFINAFAFDIPRTSLPDSTGSTSYLAFSLIIVNYVLELSVFKIPLMEMKRMVTANFDEAVADIYTRLWKPVLKKYLCVVLPTVAVLLVVQVMDLDLQDKSGSSTFILNLLYYKGNTRVKHLLWAQLGGATVVAVNHLFTIASALKNYLKQLNDEVKEQYYSKGKTLENVSLSEE